MFLSLISMALSVAPTGVAPPSLIASVQIGEQRWMRDNLATTRFRNGDAISNVASAEQWATAGRSGRAAYATYGNQASPPGWGLLYNYAEFTDPRDLCPVGWQVPTNADWRQLEATLGGGAAATATLKASTGWTTPARCSAFNAIQR